MLAVAHHQLDLFGGAERWPRRPYCTDDLSHGIRPAGLMKALTKPYIQANPPHLRIWSIFDIDRPGGAVAWEDAFLPPPNWSAVNTQNGHAHSVYGLSAPVLVDGSGDVRQAPLRYLCAVESAFRDALKADPGYAGLITKNPLHQSWRVLRGPGRFYELGELSEWVDLPKHLPKKKPQEIGLGRNVTLFDWLRHWAYRQIKAARIELTRTQWNEECLAQAEKRNGDFLHPMTFAEVKAVAKSVAKWVWAMDTAASDERFSALQAHRGRLGGLAKGVANEDKRTAAATLRLSGLSQREIAVELGVSQSAIRDWLR